MPAQRFLRRAGPRRPRHAGRRSVAPTRSVERPAAPRCACSRSASARTRATSASSRSSRASSRCAAASRTCSSDTPASDRPRGRGMLLGPAHEAGIAGHQAGGKLAAHVGQPLVDEQAVEVACLVEGTLGRLDAPPGTSRGPASAQRPPGGAGPRLRSYGLKQRSRSRTRPRPRLLRTWQAPSGQQRARRESWLARVVALRSRSCATTDAWARCCRSCPAAETRPRPGPRWASSPTVVRAEVASRASACQP